METSSQFLSDLEWLGGDRAENRGGIGLTVLKDTDYQGYSQVPVALKDAMDDSDWFWCCSEEPSEFVGNSLRPEDRAEVPGIGDFAHVDIGHVLGNVGTQ